jgi:hypothetical protein
MSFDAMGYPQFDEGQSAEIERLKSELVKAFSEVTYQRTLITELADALDAYTPDAEGGYRKAKDLIQRAREATK